MACHCNLYPATGTNPVLIPWGSFHTDIVHMFVVVTAGHSFVCMDWLCFVCCTRHCWSISKRAQVLRCVACLGCCSSEFYQYMA